LRGKRFANGLGDAFADPVDVLRRRLVEKRQHQNGVCQGRCVSTKEQAQNKKREPLHLVSV
jgi:hypothetical protein